MRDRPVIVLLTLLFASVARVATSQEGIVTATPELLEGRYCGEGPEGMSFRGRVRFVIENNSQNRILLPQFSQLMGYQLFLKSRSGTPDKLEREERFRVRALFDPSSLDRKAPARSLFDTVEPGATQARIMEVFIPLIPARRPGESLLGRDHSLYVEINNWFGAKSIGEHFRTAWKSFGHLWIAPIRARPLELHFDERPVREQCRDRID